MSNVILRKGPSGPPVVVNDTIVDPGEVLGRALTFTSSAPASALSGAQVGAITRYAGNFGIALAPGTYHNFAIPDGVQGVDIDPNPNGDVFVTGFEVAGRGNVGAFFTLGKFNAGGRVILLPNDVGSNEGNRIVTPGGVPYELTNASDTTYVQAITRDGQPTVFQVADRLVPPTGVTPELNGFAALIDVTVPFAAGGGGAADDVTVLNPLPFNSRVLDVTLLISTAVVGSTATLRSAIGGGGGALSSTLSTAATGTVRNNDTTTRTTSAGFFLRRSDSGIAGTITVTFCRI